MLKLYKFIIENTFLWFQKSELKVEPKKRIIMKMWVNPQVYLQIVKNKLLIKFFNI